MLRFLFCLTFICTSCLSFSQVSNNQIQQRVQLKLNEEGIISTTANSTVEWQCIAKALTNKCLVYHNDQWFTFEVQNPGNYFLNLSSQQCKKQQGLQAILIEGNPCEVKTYSVLQCISKISQEDTFIELSDLKANTTYLLNIDGFLGDICSFNIQLSDRAVGLPIHFSFSDTIKVNSSMSDRIVHLDWKATPELISTIEKFKVGRKREQEVKSKWKEVDLKVNAYGEFIMDYDLTDTLKDQGAYTYLILGIKKDDDQPVFLNEQRISYIEVTRNLLKKSEEQIIYFSPGFDKPSRIQVAIVDAYTDALIKNSILEYDPRKNKNLLIQTKQMIEEGVKNFVVQIKNLKTLEIKKFYFRINEEGLFQSYTKGQ